MTAPATIAEGGGRATNAVITALILAAQEMENRTGFGLDAIDRYEENVPGVNPGQLRDLADALASLAATPRDPLADLNELVAADDRECPECGADILGNDPHAPECLRGDEREVVLTYAARPNDEFDVVTLGELVRDNAHDADVSSALRTWAYAGFPGTLEIPVHADMLRVTLK